MKLWQRLHMYKALSTGWTYTHLSVNMQVAAKHRLKLSYQVEDA